jgi:hypothetical protein
MPKAMIDFPRPLGVLGAPHVGDLQAPLDLSIEAESAEEHLAHARMLIRFAEYETGDEQRLTLEALADRMARALKAIAERRLTPRSRVA